MYQTLEAITFLRAHGSFLILGHKEPDGDCVASQLGVAALVRALGKTASLFSVGPFDRPEIEDFKDTFSPAISLPVPGGAAFIIVDCSTPDRTGALGRRVGNMPCLVIDHHSAGEPFGTVRLVDSSAPSSTMLVYQLFRDLGLEPDPATSRLLLFGLCTDTGFFRHLSQNGADTFRAVASLVERGTSTADVYQMVYGKRELAGRRLLADMISRVESHWGDRFLLTWQTDADRQRFSSLQRGEDEVYRLLQTVKGNMVVALIKEEGPGQYSVGLRSTAAVDVGAIAGSFGGGGHKQASGFDVKGSLESVRKTLLDTFAPLLSAPTAQL